MYLFSTIVLVILFLSLVYYIYRQLTDPDYDDIFPKNRVYGKHGKSETSAEV